MDTLEFRTSPALGPRGAGWLLRSLLSSQEDIVMVRRQDSSQSYSPVSLLQVESRARRGQRALRVAIDDIISMVIRGTS